MQKTEIETLLEIVNKLTDEYAALLDLIRLYGMDSKTRAHIDASEERVAANLVWTKEIEAVLESEAKDYA